MRDWNQYGIVFVLFMKNVLILPMRDWNSFLHRLHSCARYVLILPMRDWNILLTFLAFGVYSFWSYLWGIEIALGQACRNWPVKVLILPMRDWNHTSELKQRPLRSCFDLTYEGLKFRNIFTDPSRSSTVLILPMRDWNGAVMQAAQLGLEFWSYLWGIVG